VTICFISAWYPPQVRGGAELSTYYLAGALVERGQRVVVVTAGTTEGEREEEGVRVVTLPIDLKGKPLFEKYSSGFAARVLAEWIARQPAFDIIHAHDFRSALALSLIPGGTEKRVVTVRDYAAVSGCTNSMLGDGSVEPGCTRDTEWRQCHRITDAPAWRRPFRAWQYWYNLPFREQAWRTFPYQIFISRAQQAYFLRKLSLPKAHVRVIYNPLSPDFMSEPMLPPVSPLSVLYVGTIERYKGVDVLLAAWGELMGEVPAASLTLVGEGADRGRYEAHVRQQGWGRHVTFAGRVAWNELRARYDQAAIVVAPHRWVEPFGRTVAEGMARGRLVIAADRGGPAELIAHEKTGLLFQAGSQPDLVRVLRRALSRPEEQMRLGKAARVWALEALDPQNVATQHVRIYQDMLSS
jgi:glycosyltransferase involved in cell wall biosynthesis